MLTKPKSILPFQMGRVGAFSVCWLFLFFAPFDLLRAIDAPTWGMRDQVSGFGFTVAHLSSPRCLTFAVRRSTRSRLTVTPGFFAFGLSRNLRM
jgi:hypothetical protein